MTNRPATSHPILLLNSAILTSVGLFRLSKISLAAARAMVQEHAFQSAIGHALTAKAVSTHLQIDCPFHRHDAAQAIGQNAIVFRLDRRLPEGAVLSTLAEIEAVGFSFSLLERLE